MRWSEAVTLEFVKIYLKHDCLWNPSNPGYKLKYKRDSAYSNISSEFKSATMKHLTVPEVKMKIKNLRTTYLQQVNKILQKSSPDSIYEPSLVWFNEMDQCLKNIPTTKHSLPFNSLQEQPEVDSSCHIWVDETLPNDSDINPNPILPQSGDEYESLQPEESIAQLKQEQMTSPYHKISKKRIKRRVSFQNSDSELATEDEFDIYGKFLASQLRKMELQKALKLQLHIHSLISEARISEIID